MTDKVQGFCPMGCGETLFLGSGDYVTCSWLDCPEPDAVSTILADAQTEHVVVLGRATFTVKHPLRERLRDELLTCQVHRRLQESDGPPANPGTYQVRVREGERWSWSPLPAEGDYGTGR